MIKLTYEFFCDLCNEKCYAEEYKCSNDPSLEFPKPTNTFSYHIHTFNLGLCNDCAAPLFETLSESIREAIRKRGET